jgi:hypothetical protein
MKKSKGILASTMVATAFVMQGATADEQQGSSTQSIVGEEVRPSKYTFQMQRLRIFVDAYWRRDGRIKKPLWIRRRAFNWQQSKSWRATGRRITIGGRVEAKLNALPQFVTNIDGVDIHFIHVRSKNKNAMPVIITHGWPGSIIELLKIIDPLTNPTAYGGKLKMHSML